MTAKIDKDKLLALEADRDRNLEPWLEAQHKASAGRFVPWWGNIEYHHIRRTIIQAPYDDSDNDKVGGYSMGTRNEHDCVAVRKNGRLIDVSGACMANYTRVPTDTDFLVWNPPFSGFTRDGSLSEGGYTTDRPIPMVKEDFRVMDMYWAGLLEIYPLLATTVTNFHKVHTAPERTIILLPKPHLQSAVLTVRHVRGCTEQHGLAYNFWALKKFAACRTPMALALMHFFSLTASGRVRMGCPGPTRCHTFLNLSPDWNLLGRLLMLYTHLSRTGGLWDIPSLSKRRPEQWQAEGTDSYINNMAKFVPADSVLYQLGSTPVHAARTLGGHNQNEVLRWLKKFANALRPGGPLFRDPYEPNNVYKFNLKTLGLTEKQVAEAREIGPPKNCHAGVQIW